MEPLPIAGGPCAGAEQRMRFVFVKPGVEIEIVELLGPKHSGEGLSMHAALVFAQVLWGDPLIELFVVRDPVGEYLVEGRKRVRCRSFAQPQPHLGGLASRNFQEVMGCDFGSRMGWIDRFPLASGQVFMKGVFDIRRRVWLTPEPLVI